MRILFFFLIISFTTNAQKYKVELTEGMVAMKDPINGGYMNFFDWKKSYVTLLYDVPLKRLTLTEGTQTYAYDIIKVEKQFQVNGCLTFILDCSKNSDPPIRTKIRLNFYQDKSTGNVFIAEDLYSLLVYNGSSALVKD
jgi:hypothetical protein